MGGFLLLMLARRGRTFPPPPARVVWSARACLLALCGFLRSCPAVFVVVAASPLTASSFARLRLMSLRRLCRSFVGVDPDDVASRRLDTAARALTPPLLAPVTPSKSCEGHQMVACFLSTCCWRRATQACPVVVRLSGTCWRVVGIV